MTIPPTFNRWREHRVFLLAAFIVVASFAFRSPVRLARRVVRHFDEDKT